VDFQSPSQFHWTLLRAGIFRETFAIRAREMPCTRPEVFDESHQALFPFVFVGACLQAIRVAATGPTAEFPASRLLHSDRAGVSSGVLEPMGINEQSNLVPRQAKQPAETELPKDSLLWSGAFL